MFKQERGQWSRRGQKAWQVVRRNLLTSQQPAVLLSSLLTPFLSIPKLRDAHPVIFFLCTSDSGRRDLKVKHVVF